MARALSPTPKRIYIRMTSWRRKRFFALLAECGNIRAAAELAGVGLGAIYRLKKKEPGFAAQMAAARSEAGARLAQRGSHDSPSPLAVDGYRTLGRPPMTPAC